jgi:3-oxoacyl-[acyl-carrier protein] reductase
MDLGLAGMKALVTGGTRGIGRSIAEHLAAEGADVAVCARSPVEVAQTVADLSSMGIQAVGRAVDVSDGPSLKQWIEEAGNSLGGIDIVVSNVSALAIGNDEAAWQAEFSTDMMGTVRAVDASMPFLERSKAPSIVVISSVSGREIDFAAGPYGVFKAALIHYAKGLSFQLAPKNIRVNSTLAWQYLLPRRRVGKDRARQSRIVRRRDGTESYGTHGQAGRNCSGCCFSHESGSKFHNRNKSCGGWCADPWGSVLAVISCIKK